MKYGDCSELASWSSRPHLQTAGTQPLSCTFSFFKNGSTFRSTHRPGGFIHTGALDGNKNKTKKAQLRLQQVQV